MSKPQSDWMEKYNALVQFGHHHGHCNASYRHSVDLADNAKPFKIGSWVVAQRKEKAMGRMDPEKANLLQKLVEEGKFEWEPLTVSVRSDKTWPVMFQTLYEYCLNHPRKPVGSIPENLIWKNSEGIPIKLGRWMHTQNKLHRNGKLRPDRCERIEVELIQAGLFTWPMSRGVRSFKRGGMNNPNNNHPNVDPHNNMDMVGYGRQHMTATDVMQLHDAGGSAMLLNNNNSLHLTADMYPMNSNKGGGMAYHTMGGNPGHLIGVGNNPNMTMISAANAHMMNIANMGMIKNEHMLVNAGNMSASLPYRLPPNQMPPPPSVQQQQAMQQHQQHQVQQQQQQQLQQQQVMQQQQPQQHLVMQQQAAVNDDDDDSSDDDQ